MALPFERKRDTIIKRNTNTDPSLGQDPGKRPVEELIQYGIINIDKPKGPTSHQVSDYVQRILKIKKSGHSGTLDPSVTGVLPVALGKATRIVQTLLPAGKEYVCIMHIHDEVDEKKIRKVMKSFTGKIKQLPPIKSAVKRQERTRNIYYLDIIEIDGKDILFKVGCQAGTYIRKLCLHPETEIISEDKVVLAKDFFVNPKPIYSMNNKKIVLKSPCETQEFNFKGKLIRFTMSSGVEFIVTPDHKMLISSEEGYIMKPAHMIKQSDYIVKALKYPFPEIPPIITDLLDKSYLVDQPEIKEMVKQSFIKKYGSIREMSRLLKIDRKAFLKGSKHAISISHIKKAEIYEKIKKTIRKFKTEKGTKVHISKINSDLAYLMGLIASDGSNTKEKGAKRYTRIKFHNNNKTLIDIFEKKYRKSFPGFNITRKKMDGGVYQLVASNSFLATICANLGVRSPQKYSDLLPILHFPKKLLASFLRGYFDGDGTAYHMKKRGVKGIYSKIDFFTVSRINAKRIHQMLLKLGITNTIFKTGIKFVISINSIAAKKRFISIVGSNHPLNVKRFLKIKKIRCNCITDDLYIGLHYKNNIEKNKSKLEKMGGNLHRVLRSEGPFTRGFYKNASKLVKLPPMDKLCIEKVKNIDSISYNGNVYDMTVPGTHNFLIETGFVSSNCHDIGKKLGTGAHMAELRRTKAGCFDETTLFTLNDLADAYHHWKEENNDKFVRKVIQPIENAVTHLPKIWVQDSAVEALCHGRDLALPGIVKLHNDINPEDLVAIMTLKGELVAIGRAELTSINMLEKNKGIAARVEKVFMKENLYRNYSG